MHAGDQLAQRLRRVEHRAAEDARVQVVVGTVDAQLEVRQAAQGVGDGGHIGREDARIGVEGEIAAQHVLMAGEEIAQAGRADLLLALDQELDVHAQLTGLQHGLQRFDRRHHLPLHIRRAAGEEVLAAHLRLERPALPQGERVGRLHVVVTVDQHGRRFRTGFQVLTVHHRVPRGGEDLHVLEAQRLDLPRRPLGGALHVRLARRVGGDRGQAQVLLQFLEETGAVLVGVLDRRRARVGHGELLN